MSSPFPLLTSIDGVSADSYTQAETYIMGLLKETFPDRSFGYGTALYWAAVVPAAVATAAMQTNAENMGASLSIKWIRDNPALADAALSEAILSNYYQVLGEGALAQGTVSVVVTAKTSYSIAAGTQFSASGFNFVSTTRIFAQAEPSGVTDTADRLLTPRSDGTWQFQVPVQAVLVGAATFVPMGAPLDMPNPPPNFLVVLAASDIGGGQNAQSIKDIAATLPQSFAAQTFGGRTHVSAMIEAAFPGTKTAVLGMGDPEQWRDTHNLLQIQTGGMVDLYVATQSAIGGKTMTVTAVLKDPLRKTWEFTLSRDLAAGLYAVVSVLPLGDTRPSMPVLSVARSISMPATGYRPLAEVPAEVAFSAYQALTVQFQDTYGDHTGLLAGATRSYDIGVLLMPLIQEINDYMIAGKLTKADNVLVRAAVPCVTRISLVVRLLDSDSLTSAEIASMREAIVNKVAQRGFGYGILSSSIITDAVHAYISGRSDVGANTVTIRGDIYAPTGETMVLEGQEIRVPDEPSKMVTKNNTVFLTDASRISITFVPVATP